MRILIGYDGSPSAVAALDDLLRAGLPATADALVLGVADLIPLPEASHGDPPASDVSRMVRLWHEERNAAVAEASSWAEQGTKALRRRLPAWRITTETQANSPAWALIDRATSWDADLLVVGSHGRSALGRAWFGSVAQSALNHAACGVRICRGRPDGERTGAVRLVLGVDGSAGSAAAVAAVAARKWPAGSAARVVTATNAEVLGVLHQSAGPGDRVPDQIERLQDATLDTLRASGLDAVAVVVDGDPKRVLVDQAAEWGADALFVGRHGLRAKRMFLGSVVAAVAARAPCSVEAVGA